MVAEERVEQWAAAMEVLGGVGGAQADVAAAAAAAAFAEAAEGGGDPGVSGGEHRQQDEPKRSRICQVGKQYFANLPT